MFYDSETIQQVNNAINVVDYAAQYLDLNEYRGEYWAICPFHENDTDPSLSFNREKNVFNCFGCKTSGSTIQFVMYYHNLSFPKAIEHLINYANLTIVKRERSEILEYLRKIQYKKKNKKQIEREYLPDNIMNRYVKKPVVEWLNEGIKQEILDKYNVRYDVCGNRIVFPIIDINGKIIAVKGRTLFSNYEELGLTKYIYYQEIGTNDFLYGLYQNLQYIKEKNEVIIFEGAKSVYKAEGYGYKNVISLETSNINEDQMRLLLQLKCDVVFALDQGVKITTQKVKNIKDKKYTYVNIGLLPKLTNVYVIEDRFSLLQPKDSPVDQGKEVWEKLYEARYKI